MRRGWAAWGLWLGLIAAGWAQDDPPTLPWLQGHSDVRPAQVVLAEDTSFSVVLDGKPVGTATVAAGTAVGLAEVGATTITLSQAGGRAEVDPAKTDLWDRVRAAQAKKEKEAALDPDAALKLPPDSLSADWYAAQLRDKFDPWLAAHGDSPLAAFVKARRDALAAELARVGAGDVRRGERWLAPEELFEWKDDNAAQALRLRLDEAAKGDPTAVPALAAQVPPLAKAAAYPALVRAALAAIDAALPRLTPEGAQASLQEKKDKLSAEETKLVVDLKASVGEVVPTSTTPQPGWGGKWADGFYRPNPKGGDGHHYVFAHHYGGLKEYYQDDDPHSMYEVLPDAEVARLQKEAASVEDIRKQKADLDGAMQTAATSAGRDRDQLVPLRAKLAAEPIDKMDQAAARLPLAASLFSSADLDGGKTVVAGIETAWPGSQALARWRLDAAAAALKDGKKPVAAALLDGVPDWPRAVRLRAEAGAAEKPSLAASSPAVPSSAPVAATPATEEAKRHDASRAAWTRAIEAGRHGGVADAWKAFLEAREQWPENPAVSDAIFYAQIAGGIAALLFLLWLWKGRD